MLGFKKKNKKQNQDANQVQETKDVFKDAETQIKPSGDFPYIVELYDIYGSNSQRLPRFGVRRHIEGGNVFLYNEKNGFKEPIPSDSDDYKEYKIEELDAEIKLLEKQIKDLKDNKTKNKYDKNERLSILKDYNSQKKILTKYKTSLQLQGLGSYTVFDTASNGGKPIFMFDRVGNFKLPIFKNIDKSLMYTPNEANLAEASDLLKENKEKNATKLSNGALINLALTVVLLIAICGVAFIGYKVAQQPENMINGLNDLGKAFTLSSEQLTWCADQFAQYFNQTNPDTDVVPNLNVLK